VYQGLFEALVIFIGVGLSLVGVVGCFVPVLPGPTLNLVAILLAHFGLRNQPFSIRQLLIFSGFTLLILLMDNLFPVVTAKLYGSSRKGLIFATIGLFVGLFMFPPLGMIPGAFIGAFGGELLSKKSNSQALKSGVATLVGFCLGFALKLGLAGVLTFYFAFEIINLY
jgi:hypothetical protein